jgi:hypothetical protein
MLLRRCLVVSLPRLLFPLASFFVLQLASCPYLDKVRKKESSKQSRETFVDGKESNICSVCGTCPFFNLIAPAHRVFYLPASSFFFCLLASSAADHAGPRLLPPPTG